MDRETSNRLVDTLVDAFWGGVDWMTGVRGRAQRSRNASSARRNAKPIEAPLAEDETDEELIVEPVTPARRFSLPQLSLSIRRPKKSAEPRQLLCPSCSHANAAPAVFCEQCHEFFLHLNRGVILGLVTAALAAFFGTEYFRSDLPWPWPLYAFYALTFLMINAALLRGAPALGFVVFLWGAVGMGAGLFVGLVGGGVARDFALSAIHTFGTVLVDYPIALAIFAVGMALGALIFIVWLSSRYGFAQAYRIVIILLASLAFIGKFTYPQLLSYKPIAESLSFVDRDEALELFDLIAFNLLRVLAVEIVVYSLWKSSRPAQERYAKRRLVPKPLPAGRTRSASDGLTETAYGLAIATANGFTRFLLQLEQGAIVLVATVRDLAIKLGQFLWIMARDLVIPVVSLVAAAGAVYFLAVGTGNYVGSRDYTALGQAAGAAVVLGISQLAFLASKARIAPAKLTASQFLFFVWFAPYFLVLFILVSLSLSAAGLVLIRWNPELDFRIRSGPLTIVAGVLLGIALVFALVRRHREGDGAEAGPEE